MRQIDGERRSIGDRLGFVRTVCPFSVVDLVCVIVCVCANVS